MSLVITSNTQPRNLPQDGGDKPYSYQNPLRDTMVIPPDSEIALQSTKIEKSGNMIIDGRDKFYHYFGIPLGGAVRPTDQYATSMPILGFAGGNQEDFENGNRVTVNTEGFVARLQQGMNYCAGHPMFMNNLENDRPSSTIVTTVKRTAAPALDFQGWNWEATQQTGRTTEDTDFNWTDLSWRQDAEFTEADGEVTTTSDNGFYVQDRSRPIANNGGVIKFDFSGGGTSGWGCGLSRINRGQYMGAQPNITRFLPPQFNERYGNPAVFNRAVGPMYADIFVMRIGNDLRIFQSCVNSETEAVFDGERNWDDTVMKEITYYGAFNAQFNTVYDVNANAGGYSEVRFKVMGEHLEIYLWGMMAGEVLICDYTTLKAAGAGKINVTFPLHQTKWALYPVMHCRGDGNHMDCKDYEYLDNYPKFTSVDELAKYDYWASLQKRGIERHFYPEKNFWNDYSNLTGGLANDGLLIPAGVNASQGIDGFRNVLICAPSRLYESSIVLAPFEPRAASATNGANVQRMFGFRGRATVQPNTATDLVCTTFSDQVPVLDSAYQSLFVRVNNLTQMSINATAHKNKGGTVSKIIGHLPRFDNAGNDTGALYFEPHEKTYISLNNSEKLFINSFDVDIVYDSEKLADSIVGRTIVCFHIRPRRR